MSGGFIPLTMAPKADLAAFGKSLVVISATYPVDAVVLLTVPVSQLRAMGRRLEAGEPADANALEAAQAQAASLARLLAQEKAKARERERRLMGLMKKWVPAIVMWTVIAHLLIAWLWFMQRGWE